MIRFYYGEEGKGKLVRDKLDEMIRLEKHIVQSSFLPKNELSIAIIDKLPEEVQELKDALKNGVEKEEKEELADILTLVKSYIKIKGYDIEEIEKIMDRKTSKIGAFEKGTFIEYVDLNPDSDDYEFWLKHFRNNSDRYIEEKKND